MRTKLIRSKSLNYLNDIKKLSLKNKISPESVVILQILVAFAEYFEMIKTLGIEKVKPFDYDIIDIIMKDIKSSRLNDNRMDILISALSRISNEI